MVLKKVQFMIFQRDEILWPNNGESYRPFVSGDAENHGKLSE